MDVSSGRIFLSTHTQIYNEKIIKQLRQKVKHSFQPVFSSPEVPVNILREAEEGYVHDAVPMMPCCACDAVPVTLCCAHDAVPMMPCCAHDAVLMMPCCACDAVPMMLCCVHDAVPVMLCP